MVASGVPEKIQHDHVREIASTALKQREVRSKQLQSIQDCLHSFIQVSLWLWNSASTGSAAALPMGLQFGQRIYGRRRRYGASILRLWLNCHIRRQDGEFRTARQDSNDTSQSTTAQRTISRISQWTTRRRASGGALKSSSIQIQQF